MISVELKVVGGKHADQRIPLDRKKFLIGREQDCQLRPNSELVSRHHCVFTVDDFSVRLRDLGSTNGTTVNGTPIRKEVVLQQGDRVVVGSLEFSVNINAVAADNRAGESLPVSEETVVAGTDTLSQMPPIRPTDDVAAETTVAESKQLSTPTPSQSRSDTPIGEMPALQPAPLDMPPAAAGDATAIALPQMAPGQTPYQPMMPHRMGYPMYGNYPYQGMPMPMYPQAQPYPGQPYPGQPYPGQPYPGQPYPGQPTQQAHPQPAAEPGRQENSSSGVPEVSLPDPSTTGIKPEAPKPAKTDSEPEPSSSKAEPSNQSADAIIKQYMQRRPGG